MLNQEPRGKGLVEHLVPEEFLEKQVVLGSGGAQVELGVKLVLSSDYVNELGLDLPFKLSPRDMIKGLEVGGPSNISIDISNTSSFGPLVAESILSDSGITKVYKPFNWKRVARERSHIPDLGENLKLGKRGNTDEWVRYFRGGKKLKKVWKEKSDVFSRDGDERLCVNRKDGFLDDGAVFDDCQMASMENGVVVDTVMDSDVLQLEKVYAKMVTGKMVLSKIENVGEQSLSTGRSLSVCRTQ
ncbi:hypothetical protein QYF36_023930 [Acer negundo]|nr:hypothetical protein QYF36_023930 [Acer negundo]